MKSKLDKIIKHYGKKHQRLKAVEELGELIVEIAKGDNIDRIIEEMADVEVMLQQLKIIYGIADYRLDLVKNIKVNRTLKRMESEAVDIQRSYADNL